MPATVCSNKQSDAVVFIYEWQQVRDQQQDSNILLTP